MFRNYFKIMFRNIVNNKLYSFINIFGLAVGISASTLIALYIADELSFDSHHKKINRIYKVNTIMDFNGEMDIALTNYALAPTLKKDYPEVESYVRFFGGSQEAELSVDKTIYKETNMWFTDSTAFEVFSYDFIGGDDESALKNPNSIVINESIAMKLFGNANCVGESVKFNNQLLTVTGVIKDIPNNSEIPVNGLISINSLPQGFHRNYEQDWFRVGFYTYLLMKNSINPKSFKSKLDEVNEKYVLPWAQANGVEASHQYSLTPMSDVHFDDGHDYDLPKGSMTTIYMFVALAAFLLLIAAFNYINLTLAQQGRRSKEVGIRKTLGASRRTLIVQFLSESLFFTTVAVILGLTFTELFLDRFNDLSGKDIHSLDILNPTIIMIEIAILLFLGLLSGAYPAFVLSSLKPVKILSGSKSNEGGIGAFRKALILLQFTFSIFMISGTFLIGDQMEHIRTMNLGFDRENLISVTLPSDTTALKKVNPWISDLESNSGVASFSRTSLPTGNSGELMFRVEKDGQLTESTIKCLFVDEYFLDVLGLKLLNGRNFSTEFNTDQSSAFIVNETAAKTFGWNDDALNKRVQWGLLENGQAQNDGKVVGVINDFNFMSLHDPLEPLILCFSPSGGRNLSVRFHKGDYTSTLSGLESSWSQTVANYAFDYSFFDQDLEDNYTSEVQIHSVFRYFSGISIILACLGLFALLSYTIQSRSKEIAVRKVLGASLMNLSWVITKDFFILLCVAFVVSSPVTYYLWKDWQSDFAYQAPLNLMSFGLAFLFTILLATIAIAYHSWRISKTDPISALREE